MLSSGATQGRIFVEIKEFGFLQWGLVLFCFDNSLSQAG